MDNLKLPREQRLKSRKTIEKLFSKGNRLFSPPIVAVILPMDEHQTHGQVGFTASKRNFKKAVTRNRLKRQMREIYRCNSRCYFSKSNFHIMFIYAGKIILPFHEIETAIIPLLKEIQQRMSHQTSNK